MSLSKPILSAGTAKKYYAYNSPADNDHNAASWKEIATVSTGSIPNGTYAIVATMDMRYTTTSQQYEVRVDQDDAGSGYPIYMKSEIIDISFFKSVF